MSLDDYMRQRSLEGLQERMAHLYPDEAVRAAKLPEYVERLEFELGTIIQMGFPGYFLIVADFINWAKNNGVPVGPGRGSGAGSLVAYCLRITDLDPLAYDLLFERFLNPERVSMPDFDVDFCQDGRDRVIQYVKDKYGHAAVSQIATFGTMAAKAVLRDVGRVLDLPYLFVDKFVKLVPNELGISLAEAREKEPQIDERARNEEELAELLPLAEKLEGITRNVGMHAGGVLIAPGRLTDFCPLYQAEGSDAAVSQFDKDDVEAIGLVKFDFLGLRTLTILAEAVRFVQRHEDRTDFRLEDLPLDDPAVYKLFADGQYHGGVPVRITFGQGSGKKAEGRLLRRHYRADGAEPAGTARLRHGGRLHRAQAGQAEAGVFPPRPRAGAEIDLRHHRLPGAGDAGGADSGGLQPR